DVDAALARLVGDERADAADEARVPRRGEPGAARRARRDVALVEALAADAVRAVGHLDGMQPDLGCAVRPPKACACSELRLALERELRDQLRRRRRICGRLHRHRLFAANLPSSRLEVKRDTW